MKAVFHLHPAVSFIYFLFAILFAVCLMHPVCILLSLTGALLLSLKTEGVKALKFYGAFILPTALLAAILNPLFNHQGVTILWYFPNGNPLTKESLLYGFAASGMLASVMGWFYCFNRVMTSDKLIYLFGKVTPALSLLLSMILRFVPKFKSQISEISAAQKGLGIYKKGKFKGALSVLSAEITVALENAVETADSMKCRGFGKGKRSFYSNYSLHASDKLSLLVTAVFLLFLLYSWSAGDFSAVFYPALQFAEQSAQNSVGFCIYGIFCLLPVMLETEEEIRWNVLKSKI